MPNRPFLPDFVLKKCGDAGSTWSFRSSNFFAGDLDQGDGGRHGRPLGAPKEAPLLRAMSEDLLPGVSVIDLKVVDYSTLRLETGLYIGNLKLGLLVKWTQMK